MPVVEQGGAPGLSVAPTAWAGLYLDAPIATRCTLASVGGDSQAATTADRRDTNGWSALRDFGRRCPSHPEVHVPEAGEPTLSDQLAEGEPKAGRSHGQRLEVLP